MGLKTMSLLSGATLSASGGTALAFAENGATIANGLQLIVPGDTDYATRRYVTIKSRQPTLNPKTGSYGKDKKSMSLTLPCILTDGSVVFNVIRIEREVHPSVSAANVLELNKVAAQFLIDADCTDFWATGSLS